MVLRRWFQLFHTLTLALSALCLIVVEPMYMELRVPWLPPYLYLALVPILVSFFTEGRWHLPNWASNVIAAAIGLYSIGWLSWNLPGGEIIFRSRWLLDLARRLGWGTDPGVNSISRDAAFPAVLVPYAGLLLLILQVVLIFRSRGATDFWRLQGYGLVQVAVASTLEAGGKLFGLLLLAYVACGLTCLALRYRISTHSGTGPQVAALTGPRWLGGFAARWTIAVVGPTLLLTVLTPRLSGIHWDPYGQFAAKEFQSPAEVGYDEEIDISHVGEVELNQEIAFSVEAVNADGRPKLDLSPFQRFRGTVLELYDGGKWKSLHRVLPRRVAPPPASDQLPDFGSGQFFLTFRVQPQKAGGLFVAEPIRLGRSAARIPVLNLVGGDKREQLFFEFTGSVLPHSVIARQEYQYVQVIAPSPAPDRAPAGYIHPRYLRGLLNHRLPELKAWTRRLVTRLATDGQFGLRREDLAVLDDDAEQDTRRTERLALALNEFLSTSNEYTYTLDLRREDDSVDPAIDFLCNTKEGHCERFATGLTLMLRTLGIPARIVKGFRGAEPHGDGHYLIRQNLAHSWVEVLVRGTESGRDEWLTLDPTPMVESQRGRSFSLPEWLQEKWRGMGDLWQNLVVEFGPDQQLEILRLAVPLGVLIGVALLAAQGIRRLLRRAGSNAKGNEATSLFARLVGLLARHGGPTPHPAQTAREFAAAAAEFLRGTPAALLADFPSEAARQLYRIRFGAETLTEPEASALDAQLNRLANLLDERDPAAERRV